MKAIPNEGYLFAGESNEMVSLVEDRPPHTPWLIEAFDTLLCARVSSLQAFTNGAKIQFAFKSSKYAIFVFTNFEKFIALFLDD